MAETNSQRFDRHVAENLKREQEAIERSPWWKEQMEALKTYGLRMRPDGSYFKGGN